MASDGTQAATRLPAFIATTVVSGLWLIYVLYFNARAFAWVVNRIVTRLLAHRNVSLSFGALSISLLGGKIMFRDVKYVSSNISVSVMDGHVLLRFWLMSFRKSIKDKSSECRLGVQLNGVDIQIFNNTEKYAYLESLLRKRSGAPPRSADGTVNVGAELQTPEKPAWMDLFPAVHLTLLRGAVTFGSPLLKRLASYEWREVHGVLSFEKASNPFDVYQTVCNFVVKRGTLRLLPVDHIWSSKNIGKEIHVSFMRPRAALYEKDTKDVSESRDLIMNAPDMVVEYRVDVAGLTTEESLAVGIDPLWEVSVSLGGDTIISYGPWADSQRAAIVKYFFPWDYEDGVVPPEPQIGEPRLFPTFRARVNFTGDSTVRVPYGPAKQNVGEKDSQWEELAVAVGRQSEVEVVYPMSHGPNGYTPEISAVIHQAKATLSHKPYKWLLGCRRLGLRVLMHNPLQWNAVHRWTFDLDLDGGEVHYVRPLIRRIIALANDWTSYGDTPDLAHFVPFEYVVTIRGRATSVFWCVNQFNVVGQPDDLDDNALLVLDAPQLEIVVNVPMLEFNSPVSQHTTRMRVPRLNVKLQLPRSSTILQNMDDPAGPYWVIEDFAFDLSRAAHRTVSPKHTDKIDLRFEARRLTLIAFGFFVRYVLFIKDNYFGDTTEMCSPDEFRAKVARGWPPPPAPPPEPENSTEIYVSVHVLNATVELPQTLYANDPDCARIRFAELNLDVRNTRESMDLELDVTPLMIIPSPSLTRPTAGPSGRGAHYRRGGVDQARRASSLFPARDDDPPGDSIHIDGLSLRGHRYYGPAPLEIAYASQYRIALGAVSGRPSPALLVAIGSWAQRFGFHFRDADNALYLCEIPDEVDDMHTTLSLLTGPVALGIGTDDACIAVRLPRGVSVLSDSLVADGANKRVNVSIDDVAIAALSACADVPEDGTEQWLEVARLAAGFRISLLDESPDWRADMRRQRRFLSTEDRDRRLLSFLWDESAGKGGDDEGAGDADEERLVNELLEVGDHDSGSDGEDGVLGGGDTEDDASMHGFDVFDENVLAARSAARRLSVSLAAVSMRGSRRGSVLRPDDDALSFVLPTPDDDDSEKSDSDESFHSARSSYDGSEGSDGDDGDGDETSASHSVFVDAQSAQDEDGAVSRGGRGRRRSSVASTMSARRLVSATSPYRALLRTHTLPARARGPSRARSSSLFVLPHAPLPPSGEGDDGEGAGASSTFGNGDDASSWDTRPRHSSVHSRAAMSTMDVQSLLGGASIRKTSTTIVHATRVIEVAVSPLVVLCISDLLDNAFVGNPLRPNDVLDSMVLSYASDAGRLPAAPVPCARERVQISVPSVRVACLQEISRVQAAQAQSRRSSVATVVVTADDDPPVPRCSSVEIALDGLSLSASVVLQPALKGARRDISAILDPAQPSHIETAPVEFCVNAHVGSVKASLSTFAWGPEGCPGGTVLALRASAGTPLIVGAIDDVSANGFRASLADTRARITVGHVWTCSARSAVPVVVSVGTEWHPHIESLAAVASERSEDYTRYRRRFVSECGRITRTIAVCCNPGIFKDSWRATSRLQGELHWRVLMHFRHCMLLARAQATAHNSAFLAGPPRARRRHRHEVQPSIATGLLLKDASFTETVANFGPWLQVQGAHADDVWDTLAPIFGVEKHKESGAPLGLNPGERLSVSAVLKHASVSLLTAAEESLPDQWLPDDSAVRTRDTYIVVRNVQLDGGADMSARKATAVSRQASQSFSSWIQTPLLEPRPEEPTVTARAMARVGSIVWHAQTAVVPFFTDVLRSLPAKDPVDTDAGEDDDDEDGGLVRSSSVPEGLHEAAEPPRAHSVGSLDDEGTEMQTLGPAAVIHAVPSLAAGGIYSDIAMRLREPRGRRLRYRLLTHVAVVVDRIALSTAFRDVHAELAFAGLQVSASRTDAHAQHARPEGSIEGLSHIRSIASAIAHIERIDLDVVSLTQSLAGAPAHEAPGTHASAADASGICRIQVRRACVSASRVERMLTVEPLSTPAVTESAVAKWAAFEINALRSLSQLDVLVEKWTAAIEREGRRFVHALPRKQKRPVARRVSMGKDPKNNPATNLILSLPNFSIGANLLPALRVQYSVPTLAASFHTRPGGTRVGAVEIAHHRVTLRTRLHMNGLAQPSANAGASGAGGLESRGQGLGAQRSNVKKGGDVRTAGFALPRIVLRVTAADAGVVHVAPSHHPRAGSNTAAAASLLARQRVHLNCAVVVERLSLVLPTDVVGHLLLVQKAMQREIARLSSVLAAREEAALASSHASMASNRRRSSAHSVLDGPPAPSPPVHTYAVRAVFEGMSATVAGSEYGVCFRTNCFEAVLTSRLDMSSPRAAMGRPTLVALWCVSVDVLCTLTSSKALPDSSTSATSMTPGVADVAFFTSGLALRNTAEAPSISSSRPSTASMESAEKDEGSNAMRLSVKSTSALIPTLAFDKGTELWVAVQAALDFWGAQFEMLCADDRDAAAKRPLAVHRPSHARSPSVSRKASGLATSQTDLSRPTSFVLVTVDHICIAIPLDMRRAPLSLDPSMRPPPACVVAIEAMKFSAAGSETSAGSFSSFAAHFVESFDAKSPNYYGAVASNAMNVAVVPRGTYKLCSLVERHEVFGAGPALNRMGIALAWHMSGLNVDLDTRVGEYLAMLGEAVTSLSASSGVQAAHAANISRRVSQASSLSRHASQSSLAATPAPALSMTDVQSSLSALAEESESRGPSRPISPVSPASAVPSALRMPSPFTRRASSINLSPAAAADVTAAAVGPRHRRARSMSLTGTSPRPSVPEPPTMQSAQEQGDHDDAVAATDLDFRIDVTVSIDHGMCTLHPAEQSAQQRQLELLQLQANQRVQHQAKGAATVTDASNAPPHDRNTYILIPAIAVRLNYQSMTGVVYDPDMAQGADDHNADEADLPPRGNSPPAGASPRVFKDGRMYVDCVVKSLPRALVFRPCLLEYVDEIINARQSRLRGRTLFGDDGAARRDAAAAPQSLSSVAAADGGTEETRAAVESFPIRVAISLAVDPIHVEVNCIPVSQVACKVRLPALSLFLSSLPGDDTVLPGGSGSGGGISNGIGNGPGVAGAGDTSAAVDSVRTSQYMTCILSDFSLNLAHPFSPVECLGIEVRRVKATVSRLHGATHPLVEGLCDVGEVLLNYNIRQLDELLVFRKVWFGRQLIWKLLLGNMYDESVVLPGQKAPAVKVDDAADVSAPSAGSKSAPVLLYMGRIRQLSVTMNLGQTIGKARWSTRGLFSEGRVNFGGDRSILMRYSVGHSQLSSKGGLLSGFVEFSKVGLAIAQRDPADDPAANAHAGHVSTDSIRDGSGGSKHVRHRSRKGAPTRSQCLDRLAVRLETAKANLEYNRSRILVIEMLDLSATYHDLWTLPRTRPTAPLPLSLFVAADIRSLRLILSKETAPSFGSCIALLGTMVAEQKAKVYNFRLNLLQNAAAAADDEEDNLELAMARRMRERQVAAALALTGPKSAHIFELLRVGAMSLRVGEATVACFWHSFLDPDWLLLEIAGLELSFRRKRGGRNNDVLDQHLCLLIDGGASKEGGLRIQKREDRGTQMRRGRREESDAMTPFQWFQFVRTARREYDIFGIPHFLVDLEARQLVSATAGTIHCKLLTEFREGIAVSLDVSLYLYIRSLVALYEDEFSRRLSSAIQNRMRRKRERTERAMDDDADTDKAQEGAREASREEASDPPRVYRCDPEHFVLQPELKLVAYAGNFTPPDLEWLLDKLGFADARGTIPKVVHVSAGKALEGLTRAVAKLCVRDGTPWTLPLAPPPAKGAGRGSTTIPTLTEEDV